MGASRLRQAQVSTLGAVFLALLLSLCSQPSKAQEISGLQKDVIHGGYALSKNGKISVSRNLEKTFIPASTIKLITSLAALKVLGPDYRFTTRLFFDTEQNLYIQGSGDPFLVSEKVTSIAKLVAEQGITEIRNLILDDSDFAPEGDIVDGSANSQNPYDANCSALGVNFNTLPLRVIHNSKVSSPEPQTPYLPLMGRIGKGLQNGHHRVNISAFPDQGSLSNTLRYCGELFQVTLRQQGVKMTGEIKQGKIPPETLPLLQYVAPETVSDLVRSCLLSSSNFMANQLYLAIGSARYGVPATWKKSQMTVNAFIRDHLHLRENQVTMVEGSGLSSKNRISPEAMIKVLESFKPYASLIPLKYGVRMKSGTLTDVYCYAGYFNSGQTLNPFVILLNQKANRRDQVLTALYHL
ncbi:MAG: D-alanyl-D-alanine carboxypeptidase [Proteobacteria bacterium]|nr:D-alanyl-D-alanine carboxypeptidase [Pseudomonadota bacterium]MBU1419816.1 D-alanyl-D-alanine carboxypeptidase [Pseudomonadota bacterium]MBU1456784.1 D-alanyl-D-alanine carboxypeptidase [Pseudomonadota bacterium]